MLALNAVDCGFEAWSGQTKEYKIGICMKWKLDLSSLRTVSE
jgi:hypothetical protein